jgi:hypothetical protein
MQRTAEEMSHDVRTLFRQVNDRVLEVNRALGPTALLPDFVCECRDAACAERLTLSVAQFESIRRQARRYVVRLGHDEPTDERIVEIHKGFAVVERRIGLALVEPEAAA